MNETSKFITDIIMEAALDSRISDGIVDLKDIGHVQIVAELLYDKFEDEALVNEFVSTFLNEGKHPERQAYNKEGWLVTFPSKEYRDAAIKKGTHSISDPTHGKGGMNLYYKRKGKQKRQTQQATTQAQGAEPAATKPAAPATPTSAGGVKQAPSASTGQPAKDPVASRLSKLSPDTDTSGAEPAAAPAAQAPAAAAPTSTQAPETPQAQEKPTSVPAIDVPVVSTPPVQYAEISKKFAKQKGWIEQPYGSYRDAEGNTMAVVGLTGEVVPVKSNDREEYKLFAEKQMPA